MKREKNLVHTFSIKNINLGFDQESGSLHIFDDISFDVLNLYIKSDGKRPVEEELAKISNKYSSEYLTSCRDIEKLIEARTLFTEPVEMKLSDFYIDEPRIKAMCLHVCHDCNLRCKYCFADGGDYKTGNRGFLSFETGKKAIDFLIEQSGKRRNIDIDFFGGEPLLNWDVVVQLTEYCKIKGPENGKDIRLTITTNAINLDDEKIEYINNNMVNCVLSMDGRPEVHDNMRTGPSGKGSYDTVVKNIKNFMKSRKKHTYFVRGTYTRENIDFSEDVMHIVSLGVSDLSIEPVVGPKESSYSIKKEDLPEIFTEYEKLAEKYYEAGKSGNKFEFFHFTLDLEKGPCSYKRLKGCGVGSEYIAVTPNGDIYPCHQFAGEEKFKMGNVTDETIILDKKIKDEFKGLLVPEKEECNNCWAKYFCSGGCPANAYFASGDVHGIYETGCKIQKKRLECALWVKAKQAIDKSENKHKTDNSENILKKI